MKDTLYLYIESVKIFLEIIKCFRNLCNTNFSRTFYKQLFFQDFENPFKFSRIFQDFLGTGHPELHYKLNLLKQFCTIYCISSWCFVLPKIFWNKIEKKGNKGKGMQMGDFIHRYCRYHTVTTKKYSGNKNSFPYFLPWRVSQMLCFYEGSVPPLKGLVST